MTRAILIIVLLLGFAVAVSGGLEQAALGRASYLVSQAVDSGSAKLTPADWAETRHNIEVSYNLTTASMYLGVTVGMVACVGLYFQERKTR